MPPLLAVTPSWIGVFLAYGAALKVVGSNDLGSVALIAKGKIDLRTEQIELDFDRRTRSLSVSELLPVFALRGDLSEPRVHLGAAAIAGHVVDLGCTRSAARVARRGLSPGARRLPWSTTNRPVVIAGSLCARRRFRYAEYYEIRRSRP